MPASSSVKSRPIELITGPFLRFSKMEAGSGVLLLAATVVALVWANSPWEPSYHSLWAAKFSITLGGFSLSESRHNWVNDGLMAIFFFLVGLEIKREVLIGELSSFKKAAFPFMAALGGSLIPALIYLGINRGDNHARGWGIPMATDIAFTIGVLALLGRRVPPALKVFVTALAIVDDIFAVLVIAIFYTQHISLIALGLGLAGVGLSYLVNHLGVRHPAVYALIGVGVWFAVLHSGVHATVAGILLAFTIPVRTYTGRTEFLRKSRALLDRFEQTGVHSTEAHNAIRSLELNCEMVEPPLHRMEHALQPWVSFLIMPLFALSNAGVHVLGRMGAALRDPVALGVLIGLFCGKPLGIILFSWLSSITKLASAPVSVSWKQIFGASWLCGIGFTMSLFIAGLAFGEGELLDLAKMGTLAASLLAGIAGSVALVRAGERS